MKNNYLERLEECYATMCEWNPQSRLEYIGESVFDFTTYDSAKSELFALKAIEFCQAITNRTTFKYIDESDSNYTWFLVMANYSRFYTFLEWGTSIRGAWWSLPTKDSFIPVPISGLSPCAKSSLHEVTLDLKQWEDFIRTIAVFVQKEKDEYCNQEES